MAEEKERGKGELLQIVRCDRQQCEFNHTGSCWAKVIQYRNRLCRTYSRLDGADLMKAPFRANCHKRSGKYRSDGEGAY